MKGSFHKIVNKVAASEPTVVNKGDTFSVWGRNDMFNGQMNSLKPGQVVKLTYTEERQVSRAIQQRSSRSSSEE